MKYICVFAGTSEMGAQEYKNVAEELGKLIVKNGYGLVCGGANKGLMNIITNSVLEEGGKVIGVVTPEISLANVVHSGIEIIEEPSLSVRKATMAKLSDAFIALPGGYGTLDEITEIAVHHQFAHWGGLVIKPMVVLNANNFFQYLEMQLDRCVKENFMTPTHRAMICFESSPANVLQHIIKYKSPHPDNSRWWEATGSLAELNKTFGLLQNQPTIEMTVKKNQEEAETPKLA